MGITSKFRNKIMKGCLKTFLFCSIVMIATSFCFAENSNDAELIKSRALSCPRANFTFNTLCIDGKIIFSEDFEKRLLNPQNVCNANNVCANQDFACVASQFFFDELGFSSQHRYKFTWGNISACQQGPNNYHTFRVRNDEGVSRFELGDHTLGDGTSTGNRSGEFLIVDGETTSERNLRNATPSWMKEITVIPQTEYEFSAWVTNIGNFPPNYPRLDLGIIDQQGAFKSLIIANGAKLDETWLNPSRFGIELRKNQWQKLSTVFNAGNHSKLTLAIVSYSNQNGVGNDFGVDDIQLREFGCQNTQVCPKQDLQFLLQSENNQLNSTFSWDFGDGKTSAEFNPVHSYDKPGIYTVNLTISIADSCTTRMTHEVTVVDSCPTIVECEDCVGSFAPIPERKYVLSAWVSEANVVGKLQLLGPVIELDFEGSNQTLGPFTATGLIIDGWQRIEQTFIVPAGSTAMKVRLKNSGTEAVYFDDVKFSPFNANMKSFVYHPTNLRLVSELDENHYATFYEYDQTGALIRVEKETERGIMTIQESQNNTSQCDKRVPSQCD